MKTVHDYSTSFDGNSDMSSDSYPAQPSLHEKKEGKKEAAQLHESVLDSHHDTLMKAHAIKSNPHIMKQLNPHIQKKLTQAQDVAGDIPGKKPRAKAKQILSTDELRAKEKTL